MLLCREMDGSRAEIFRCRGLCFLNGRGTERIPTGLSGESRIAAENLEEQEAMYGLGLYYEEGEGANRTGSRLRNGT